MIRWSGPSIVVALLACPACFYVDPINERPSADILDPQPSVPYRGDGMLYTPKIIDPDGDVTTVEWRAYACDVSGCDDLPAATGTQLTFQFEAPKTVLHGEPATLLHVELDVTDAWGAKAAPQQSVDLALADHDPLIASPQSTGHTFEAEYPVNTPVRIVVQASDEDDPGAITFDDPVLYPPSGVPLSAATLTRVDTDDTDSEAKYDLYATDPGAWQLVFTVRDPLDHTYSTTPYTVSFGEDKEPCLGVTDPAFPPTGAYVVVDQLRRFSVETVLDDLDVYPPPAADDPYLGPAQFRWFLDGAPLDVDGNSVEIDPTLYAPGTRLALRVEAVDRIDQPLCDGALASCEDRPGCFQRQTWSVEVH